MGFLPITTRLSDGFGNSTDGKFLEVLRETWARKFVSQTFSECVEVINEALNNGFLRKTLILSTTFLSSQVSSSGCRVRYLRSPLVKKGMFLKIW